jgi:OOP family OmpA-OmpF porin
LSEKRKRRTRALGAGIGAGAAVTAALFTLALSGLGGAGGGQPAWVRDIEIGLAKRGFDWIDIAVADRVATVTGEAPDVDSHRFGFEAAEAALQGEKDVAVVVDATNLEGGPAGVGAALAALGAAPSLEACQQAFTATLQGRAINFQSGSAGLDGDNRRLLDTLSGVAIRCHAYRIEIGGHTDAKGRADANQTLSEQRANTVRGYLMGKGVSGETLTAVGFGSTRPVDVRTTAEADALNRRIEFTVSAS